MKLDVWMEVAASLAMCSAIAVGQAIPGETPKTKISSVAATPYLESHVPTTEPDPTQYLNYPDLLKFCTAQVAAFNEHDADMIFIGDSITAGWQWDGKSVWETNFTPRNALDFGVSGDSTQNALWRLENYPLARLHPKVGVVLIGTNNQGDTPEAIAAGVKGVLNKTQTLFPKIKIILVSIMPNQRANEKMMATNTILKTFADNTTVYYLDLVPLMPRVGDNWKGLSADHLHPDAAGYQLWADALLPLVNRLMPPSTTGK